MIRVWRLGKAAMDLREALRQFIVNELISEKPSEPIGDADNLFKLGLVDSLGLLRLAGFIEDEFGVEVSPDEMKPEYFLSIDAMADFVESKK